MSDKHKYQNIIDKHRHPSMSDNNRYQNIIDKHRHWSMLDKHRNRSMIDKQSIISILKKDKNNSLSGSITVEAAMVMPIVIFTIFAIIYLAFYLHDMCKVQGMVNKTLHKAGITVKHDADIATGEVLYEDINDRGVFYLLVGSTKNDEETQVQNYLKQELSKGLFISKITAVDVKVGKLKITISVEADTNVSLPIFKYLFDSFSHKEIKGEYPVHNPCETIRCAEVILKTGSQIKGVDKLHEKLKDIFNIE